MIRRDERGFAIPVTVLLIALITVMLTSGFVRARADRQVAESQEVSAEALSIARGGLHVFMEGQDERPPDGIVDTMYVTGGYAIVVGNIVQRPADTLEAQTWVLRSTGYVIDPGTGSVPRARRTVAQFARWQVGTINVRGTLAAANGIRVERYGTVDIHEADAGSGCPSANDEAIRTPQYSNNSNGNFDVHGSFPTPSGTGAGHAAAMDIDWTNILTGGLAPDYYAIQNGNMSYPVTMILGDTTLSSTFQGSGLLVVTGDLEISASGLWNGVMLVGGNIEFRPPIFGNITIEGYVASGLNELIGQNPSRTQFGYDSPFLMFLTFVTLRYNSCQVENALAPFTGFTPMDNAWVDNWATY